MLAEAVKVKINDLTANAFPFPYFSSSSTWKEVKEVLNYCFSMETEVYH
jgi:hypothetical protein